CMRAAFAYRGLQELSVSERIRVVMKASRISATLAGAMGCLLLAACSSSGDGASSPPPVTTPNQAIVSFSLPSTGATVDQGQTVSVAVQLSSDPGGKGVTWTLQNAVNNQTPQGTLSNATATSVTY